MMPVSADGFIEGPERELDWHKADSELHRHFNEQLLRSRPALGSREKSPLRGPAGQLQGREWATM